MSHKALCRTRYQQRKEPVLRVVATWEKLLDPSLCAIEPTPLSHSVYENAELLGQHARVFRGNRGACHNERSWKKAQSSPVNPYAFLHELATSAGEIPPIDLVSRFLRRVVIEGSLRGVHVDRPPVESELRSNEIVERVELVLSKREYRLVTVRLQTSSEREPRENSATEPREQWNDNRTQNTGQLKTHSLNLRTAELVVKQSNAHSLSESNGRAGRSNPAQPEANSRQNHRD